MTTLDTLKVFLEGDASSFNRALAQASAAVDKHAARMKRMEQIDEQLGKGKARLAERVIAAQQRQEAAQARAAAAAEKAAARAAAAERRKEASYARAAAAMERAAARIAAAQSKSEAAMKRAAATAEKSAARAAAAQAKQAWAAEKAANRMAVAQAKQAKASQEGGGFARWVKGTATEINSVMSIIGRLSSAIAGVYKVAEEGARVSTAASFFTNAGKNLQDFRNATKGLVSDMDLIKKSNLADSMGISAEAFKNLAAVAQAASAKTGQSYSHMLDSIIVGTARESRLLLDNLGIIIDVKKAKESYIQRLREQGLLGELAAKSNKQLALSLTDAAEKEAFLEAAMKAGSGMLDEYAKSGDKGAEAFDRLTASMTNLKTDFGSALARTLQPAIESLADFIEKLRIMKDEDLMAMFSSGGFGFLSKESQKWGEGDDNKINEAYTPNYFRKEEQLFILKGLKEAGLTLDDAMGRTARQYTENNAEIAEAIRRFQALNRHTKLFAENVAGITSVFNKGKKAESKFKTDDAATTGPVVDTEVEWNTLMEGLDVVGKMATDAAEGLDKFRFVLNKQDLYRNANPTGTGLMPTAGGSPGDLERRARRQAELKQKADEEAQAAADLEAAQAGKINQATGLLGALKGGQAQGIGQAIGGFFGPLGEALGSLIGELVEGLAPVMQLLGHVAKGVSALLKLALEPLLSILQPLGPALEILLGALGVLIGAALKPLIPILQLVVTGLTWFLNGLSWVLIVINPVVEMLAAALLGAFNILVLWDNEIAQAAAGAAYFTRIMMEGAVRINNTIVRFMRAMGTMLEDVLGAGNDFGLKKAGRYLQFDDLLAPIDEGIGDNTDATLDNTRATRDLAQELRNMPQGYKINYALYNAQAPVGPVSRPGAGALTGRGLNRGGLNNSNFRRRT